MTVTINTVDSKSFTTECTEDQLKDLLIDVSRSACTILDQKMTTQYLSSKHIVSIIVSKE